MSQMLKQGREYIIVPTSLNNMKTPILISVQHVTERTYQYTNEDHPNTPQFRVTHEEFHRNWTILEEL